MIPRQQINPLQIIGSLTGQQIKAAAIVCSVGEEEETTVTAYISPKEASPRFSHAIDMEYAYSKTLLAFDESPPPYYGNTRTVDLKQAAAAIGVDRVLCMVSLTGDGTVFGTRDYDGVEMTVLEAATEQLTEFKDLLENMMLHHGQGCLQSGAGRRRSQCVGGKTSIHFSLSVTAHLEKTSAPVLPRLHPA